MKSIRQLLLALFCCLWMSTGSFAQTFAAQFSAADEKISANSLHHTLEYNRSGLPSFWSNPDSQISGMSQSLNTFQAADSTYCREFQETVDVAGHQTDAYGTACRQADGHWKIISTGRRDVVPVQRVRSQPMKRIYPAKSYGSFYAPTWWYPGYLVFGLSIYDDHHLSYSRSDKHRSHVHRHSYSSREKDRSRGWSRKHDRLEDRGWDDHRGRGRGRGGDDWHKGRH